MGEDLGLVSSFVRHCWSHELILGKFGEGGSRDLNYNFNNLSGGLTGKSRSLR